MHCKSFTLIASSSAYEVTSTGMDCSERQTTLDATVSLQPRVPLFTSQGLIDHLVELIVSEDEAFNLLEKEAFRRLIIYLRPTLTDCDIPHRTKICEEVITRMVEGESNLKAALEVCSMYTCHDKC